MVLLPLYNTFIRFYGLGIRLASLWNEKARAWIEGRENLFTDLQPKVSGREPWIWMHCSSAGEFEQGKPIAEALKKTHPSHNLLISFFSPSGFAAASGYNHADAVCYLPLDTPGNAQRFLELVKPELVIFVKYEFWYHHLSAAAFRQIPLLLVSAVFRPDQIFFKKSGAFFRHMLHFFRHIFVQDPESLHLLQANGINNGGVSGDTRFDRVKAIAAAAAPVPFVDGFLQGKPTIVAGSTWTGDEELLKDFVAGYPDVRLVVAPHEVNDAHIRELQKRFPEAALYSALQKEGEKNRGKRVLIIDYVGLLSRLYQHATVTYVGGGFTRDGIHNILEAAVWGKPVVFGPNHKKYREAQALIDAGGGFSVGSAEEMKKLAGHFFGNEECLQAVSEKAKAYVEANTGATEKVLAFIQEKRLLTNW